MLGLSDTIGDFSVGKEFDALWLRPSAGSHPRRRAAARRRRHDDALAKAFALAGPADVAATWVAGERVSASEPAPGGFEDVGDGPAVDRADD